MPRVSDYKLDYDRNIHQKTMGEFAKRKRIEEDKKKKKPSKQDKGASKYNADNIMIESDEEKENWKSI